MVGVVNCDKEINTGEKDTTAVGCPHVALN
jgi:hypothetical protein